MKRFYFVIIILFSHIDSNSQDYYHSFGFGGIYAMNTCTFTENSIGMDDFSGDLNTLAGGFYKAVFVFDVNNDDDFALSTAPLLGVNLNGGSNAFSFDIPLYAEYYFGGIDDFCLFMQAGFSYTYISGAKQISSIVGPRFGIGAHFRLDTISYIVSLSLGYGLNNNGNQALSMERIHDNRSLLNFSIGYFLDD